MAQINQIISDIPNFGKRGVQTRDDFVAQQELGQDHLSDVLEAELNTFGSEANTLRDEVNGFQQSASTSATASSDSATESQTFAENASASANNKGAWSGLTGAYNSGISVTHNDATWILDINLADITLSEPTDVNGDWTHVSISPINPSFKGSITEQVSVLAGTVLDASLGTIQTKTISVDTTFTENLSSGQYMSLVLTDAGSYTITYPTITWVTGEAPTLTADDTIVFFKVNTELYGVYIGTNVAV